MFKHTDGGYQRNVVIYSGNTYKTPTKCSFESSAMVDWLVTSVGNGYHSQPVWVHKPYYVELTEAKTSRSGTELTDYARKREGNAPTMFSLKIKWIM